MDGAILVHVEVGLDSARVIPGVHLILFLAQALDGDRYDRGYEEGYILR